jgi:putative DNA primase/helicase
MTRRAPAPPPPTSAELDLVTEDLKRIGSPPLTDAGNAERFATCNAMTVRYAHDGMDAWLVWDGQRYAVDKTERVKTLALECVRLAKNEVPALTLATAKEVVKHAIRSEGRIEHLLTLARAMEPLAITTEQLDRDAYCLNVANGIVDLKTGVLSPHRYESLHTKLVPIAYDPEAKAPAWEKFLTRILPDANVRGFVQRAAGYSLTGDVSEHCLFFCYGTGRNGKSTLFELLRTVAGDYTRAATPDLLLAKRSDRHEEEFAGLRGVRFVTTVEAGDGRSWDETRVKWLTGGDRLTARHMYGSRFEFAPTHKFWIAANHMPRVHGMDTGFWRRMHLVPFNVTIPEEEVDPYLRTKLEAELPGILRWAIDGALAWREGGLKAPQQVRAATEDYRSQEDVLGHFVSDCCVLGPREWAPTQALHEAYERWAERNGERSMGKIALGNALAERSGIARQDGAQKIRGFSGVGLLPGGESGELNLRSETSAKSGPRGDFSKPPSNSPKSPSGHPCGCRCAGDTCAILMSAEASRGAPS